MPIILSLFGFGIGTIFAVFQIVGIMLVFSVLLYKCVMNVIDLDPRCFICPIFVLSGPVELLFCVCFSALIVSCSVICMCSVCSVLVLRSIFRFIDRVLYFIVLVN